MKRSIPLAALVATIGSLLAVGSAEAATSGLCYFDNAGGTLPGTSCTNYAI
jgi:hypothetical protein